MNDVPPASTVISAGLRPTNYANFVDIQEALTSLKLEMLDRRREYGNKTAALLSEGVVGAETIFNERMLPKLIARLKEYGFKRLENVVMGGSSAIVLMGHDHQVIRIVTTEASEKDRPKLPYVLQPVAHEILQLSDQHSFRVEVLPEAVTLADILLSQAQAQVLGITGDVNQFARHMIEQLTTSAYQNGLCLHDPCPTNIAVVRAKDGALVPLVLDAGAMVPIADMQPLHWQNLAAKYQVHSGVFADHHAAAAASPPEEPAAVGRSFTAAVLKDQRNDLKKVTEAYWRSMTQGEVTPDKTYRDAQQAHLERLNLLQGEVANAMTPEQRQVALKKYAENRQYPNERVREDGTKEPLEKRTPLQASYYPEHSLGYALLREGVTPSELKYIGGRAQRDEQTRQLHMSEEERKTHATDPMRPGFCERLHAVVKTRSIDLL